MDTYRANELWIRLMNSKLLTASPRSAGVNVLVKSLNCCRFSPRSIPAILLTIFSSATLAQALLLVCRSKPRTADQVLDKPDLQTKAVQGMLPPAYQDRLPASGTERSARRPACCLASAERQGIELHASLPEKCQHLFIQGHNLLHLDPLDPELPEHHIKQGLETLDPLRSS